MEKFPAWLVWAGRLVEKLKTRHFPRKNEIAIIELQCARNSIFIKIKRQNIAWGVVLLARLEIADRNRPASDIIQLWNMGGFFHSGIGNWTANKGCRFIHLIPLLGTIIDLDFERALSSLRRRQNAFQMFGWKYHTGIELEFIAFRFGQAHGHTSHRQF